MVLHIGVHHNNLHLSLAQGWPSLFVDAVLVPYAEGRDSARLLHRGTIDVCGTGSTPPILAAHGGASVRYLAASMPRPANGGLLVAAGSGIAAVAGLSGARVALLDGSFHTYLLARELEKVGLGLPDVQRVELSPAASLRALESGAVDAWVAMSPLLDQSLAAGRTRLLARCGDTIPNRSVFWTMRGRDAAPDPAEPALAGFVQSLMALGAAIQADPGRAAALLAEPGAGPDAIRAWRDVVLSRDWRIVPADDAIAREQQDEADTLRRHGALPKEHAL